MTHHPREESAADRWARFRPIVTGDDYVESLRGRGVEVWLFGERIDEPVDHPIIRPSINALKMTYDLAIEDPDLATAHSDLIDRSEEHTSELQSLMRISYDVFCLKKKKQQHNIKHPTLSKKHTDNNK